MGGLMLLIPGEFGERPDGPLPVHEACGIRWDDNDRLRFMSKCKWESRVEVQLDQRGDFVKVTKRCLVWKGAKSRGGAHRAAGRKAGNKQWYGSFSVKGKTVRAHRFAAVAIHGLRPTSFDEIDHTCYNTLCVFCLECVPKHVNQGRIRRGANATGKLSAGVFEDGPAPAHVNCRCTTDYPLDPDAD